MSSLDARKARYSEGNSRPSHYSQRLDRETEDFFEEFWAEELAAAAEWLECPLEYVLAPHQHTAGLTAEQEAELAELDAKYVFKTRYRKVDRVAVREALDASLQRRTKGAVALNSLCYSLMTADVDSVLNGRRATFTLNEASLAKRYRVSVDTVRRAKQKLSSLGMITLWKRQHHAGTAAVYVVGREFCEEWVLARFERPAETASTVDAA